MNYNGKNEVEESMKEISIELEKMHEENETNNEKYTKLMFELLLRSMYLQNF